MEWWAILLIILAIVAVILAVLYFVGKRMQKKQEAQQEQIEAAKQTVSMLIIDKKRMKIKESGLPQMVIDQTPKLRQNGDKKYALTCQRKIFRSSDSGDLMFGKRRLTLRKI